MEPFLPGKASTLRLEPAVQAGLNQLSKALRRPKNRLINDAVKLYVRRRSLEVEQELETTLKALRACRRKEPDFEASIEAFVKAEAELAGEDPAEGRRLSPDSPVQSEIQRRLHA